LDAYELWNFVTFNNILNIIMHKYATSQFHFNLKRHSADEYGIVALPDGTAFNKERYISLQVR